MQYKQYKLCNECDKKGCLFLNDNRYAMFALGQWLYATPTCDLDYILCTVNHKFAKLIISKLPYEL